MKGVIFTEFSEMVENEFGIAMLDEIIESCNLPTKGVYTSVGTYSHHELVSMLTKFCELSQTPVNEALRLFGHHLIKSFKKNYVDFFENKNHVFDFIESIDNHIHIEVYKLYPDAQLPRFNTKRIDSNTLHMEYISDKHLEWLAVGLIEGALLQFKVEGKVELLEPENKDNTFSLIQIQLR
jgi:hypothetical protein